MGLRKMSSSCTSTVIDDLPPPIITDILSRLPIKSTLLARCVCKLWLELVSNSNSNSRLNRPASLLLSPTNICLSGRDRASNNAYKTLHLLNPQEQDTQVLESFTPGTHLPDLPFCLAGSCHGLLSLYHPQTNDPIYVSNPVSGDFITLPPSHSHSSNIDAHAFGFSPTTNNYKVVRIVHVGFFLGVRYGYHTISRTAQVYTLGDGSGAWRSLGDVPEFSRRVTINTFLNGIVHWDTFSDGPYVSFDFDTERFGVVYGPRRVSDEKKDNPQKKSLGVLRGCLCVCHFQDPAQIEIWVMKDYGVQDSWTKDYVVQSMQGYILQNSISRHSPGLLYCEVLMILDSGEILMLLDKRSLVACDPYLQRFRLLNPLAASAQFEAVSYTPTIASLKVMAPGEHIKACKGCALENDV